jgi:hypothetical protein
MSEREWTDEEALAAVREVCAAAGAKPYGEFPILGRAILRLRDELEAVSARCVNTAKDRDRWQEMYNSEHRSHVNAVVALRDENAELRAKVERMERVIEAATCESVAEEDHTPSGKWTDSALVRLQNRRRERRAAVDTYNAAEGK